jgi:hypothetical protein
MKARETYCMARPWSLEFQESQILNERFVFRKNYIQLGLWLQMLLMGRHIQEVIRLTSIVSEPIPFSSAVL